MVSNDIFNLINQNSFAVRSVYVFDLSVNWNSLSVVIGKFLYLTKFFDRVGDSIQLILGKTLFPACHFVRVLTENKVNKETRGDVLSVMNPIILVATLAVNRAESSLKGSVPFNDLSLLLFSYFEM